MTRTKTTFVFISGTAGAGPGSDDKTVLARRIIEEIKTHTGSFARGKAMYAKVIVDIVHSEVDRVFEYLVPDGLSLEAGFRVRVPFGRGNALREGYVIALTDTPKYQGDDIKSIHSVISDFAALTPGQIKLAQIMRRYYHTTLAASLRLMFPAEMRGGRVRDRFEREYELAVSGDEYDAFAASLKTKDGRVKAPKQLAVMEALKAGGRMASAELLKAVPGSMDAVRALVGKGAVRAYTVETLRSPRRLAEREEEFVLTDEQCAAVNAVVSAPGKYLLHGVTGSGKTEVYIEIVRHFLAQGKSAIVLVPEISLTPQLVAMCQRRIGSEIAVYHSTLTPGERYDEWKRMATGQARVVIGARSAVFAPLRDIGVIIIDEEHESSYKSDTHPRYSAHEVARMRANIERRLFGFGHAVRGELYQSEERHLYADRDEAPPVRPEAARSGDRGHARRGDGATAPFSPACCIMKSAARWRINGR